MSLVASDDSALAFVNSCFVCVCVIYAGSPGMICSSFFLGVHERLPGSVSKLDTLC